MPSSVPDTWDMDIDQVNNPQYKRKQTGSPSTDPPTNKKASKTPTAPKTPEAVKTLTTTESDVALSAATRATEYACELVQSLADEFYHEELIGPCLSKVVKTLEQVCNALQLLSREQNTAPSVQQPRRKDAFTNTDSPDQSTENNPPAIKAKARRRKIRKNKSDTRTPKAKPRTQGKEVPLTDPAKQQEDRPAEPEEVPFTLVEKATRKPPVPRPQPPRKIVQRPAALLVKVSEGKTYADTLRAVRGTAIDFEGMGTHVTAIRKTLKGDLLVELTKGAKAIAATSVIRDKLAESMAGSVVTRLRHTAEVEITDLDEVTTKAEVLAAILKALREEDLPSAEDIKITGLWVTRDSRQMATATVPVAISRSLTSIRVGWTQCRVRPRRPEPARCYRCHRFGHSTRQCTGPDLSTACGDAPRTVILRPPAPRAKITAWRATASRRSAYLTSPAQGPAQPAEKPSLR